MKKWTNEEIELVINSFKEKKSFTEIAKISNKSYSSIKNFLNKRGCYASDNILKYIICPQCNGKYLRREKVDGKIKVKIKFCSNSCSASYNNRRNIRLKKERKKCLNCENKCNYHQTHK